MEGSGGNPKNIPTAIEANNVERNGPGEIHQIEGATSAGCKQIVFLVGMKIKLLGSGFGVVGRAHGGPGVHNEISGVG